ncbi:hypothetical protein Ahy_A01g003595 isoform A [Arachis hypogaea]|uniref:Uncharacterized protein n=1 Tax=Arachis hypogaea TaxID=3818 RepID=A0A445ETT1_ARAHY|nr:hypothetical protein Ahy_A01g003595 isoform A [Arachis hypogaea]
MKSKFILQKFLKLWVMTSVQGTRIKKKHFESYFKTIEDMLVNRPLKITRSNNESISWGLSILLDKLDNLQEVRKTLTNAFQKVFDIVKFMLQQTSPDMNIGEALSLLRFKQSSANSAQDPNLNR